MSLQDYVKRLWNHSNTKIPITIGKGTDTAKPRSKAPQGGAMSGLVRETSHLWLYSSPSPGLQPILREPATSILIVLYTFECIMWVATESLWKYVQGNK